MPSKYKKKKWDKWVKNWGKEKKKYVGSKYISATTKDAKDVWFCSVCNIYGKNFAHSTLVGHMNTLGHKNSVKAKETRTENIDSFFSKRRKLIETTIDNKVDNDSVLGMKALSHIQDLSDSSLMYLSKLFSIVFFIGLNFLPYSMFQSICEIMGLLRSGTFAISKYQNDASCKTFTQFISKYLEEFQLSNVRKSPFWGLIVDGTTTDKLLNKKLIIYLVYLEKKNCFEKKVDFYKLLKLDKSDAKA